MPRSFVVGNRSSRVVFGPPLDGFGVANGFCAEAVVMEQTRIAIERKQKRKSIFIEYKERSEQSAVEPIGCNSDFIRQLDALLWRFGFKVNGGTQTCGSRNFGAHQPGR